VCIVAAELVRAVVMRDRAPLTAFSSEVGRFRVMLPPGIATETDETDTRLGMLRQTMYKARAKYIQFLVAFTDYPAEYMAQTKPADLLAETARSAAGNIRGKLKSEKAFVSKGQAIREIWVQAPKGIHMRSRLMLVGDRMYQVTALARRRHVFNRKIDEVFESFEVLPGSQPAPTNVDATAGAAQSAPAQR
jgi:hypothetical protein